MIFRQIADAAAGFGVLCIFAKEPGVPGCGMHGGQKHFDESCFTRSVRSEKAIFNADRDAQRQVRNSFDFPAPEARAIDFLETIGFDGVFSAHLLLGYETARNLVALLLRPTNDDQSAVKPRAEP